MSFKVIGTSAMTIRGVFRSSVVGVRLESKCASGFSDLVEEIIFSKIKLMSRECKTDWLNLWNPSKVVFFSYTDEQHVYNTIHSKLWHGKTWICVCQTRATTSFAQRTSLTNTLKNGAWNITVTFYFFLKRS